MDYAGVAFSVLNQGSQFVAVLPVSDVMTAGRVRQESLNMKAFAANGQSRMDTVSITGTAEMAMANVHQALIQPLVQPPVKYEVGWNSPRVSGERLDLLIRVTGRPDEPFVVTEQPVADPTGP